MWKFLLAAVIVEIVLAFVCFAIVRAGAERDPSEADEAVDGVKHQA